jgi:hypothetical protein
MVLPSDDRLGCSTLRIFNTYDKMGYVVSADGKKMPVIPSDRVVNNKIIIRKNGGPRRRRGTRGS